MEWGLISLLPPVSLIFISIPKRCPLSFCDTVLVLWAEGVNLMLIYPYESMALGVGALLIALPGAQNTATPAQHYSANCCAPMPVTYMPVDLLGSHSRPAVPLHPGEVPQRGGRAYYEAFA